MSAAIPSLACVLTAPGTLTLQPEQCPAPDTGEVRLRMLAAALNHRDEWIRIGQYAGIRYPAILGSDGCGVVEAVGDASLAHWLGQRVIINPNNDWGDDARIQGKQYTIRGLQTPGTLQQHLTLPAHRLQPAPAYLSDAQAAALPLAGLTAYRALVVHGAVQAGMRVLVTGIGGGVALLALQWAQAMGAQVWCTSSSPAKLQLAQDLGASGGVNYKESGWAKNLKTQTGGFDLIIDSAGGEGLNDLIELCKPAGSIILYGATQGLPPNLNVRKLFWNQIRIQGSTMGNDAEFAAMLALANHKQVVPVVSSIHPLEQVHVAFAQLQQGSQFGKVVVTIAT